MFPDESPTSGEDESYKRHPLPAATSQSGTNMSAMLPTQRYARAEVITSMGISTCPTRLAAGCPFGAAPTCRPGSSPHVPRWRRPATPRPCRAATLTAPPQTTQTGAGEGRQVGMEDAARDSEPSAAGTRTRAVVIGGSAAGMFAAAAAAPHFDEVSPPAVPPQRAAVWCRSLSRGMPRGSCHGAWLKFRSLS